MPVPNLAKTWEIVEISNNKILSFLDADDTIVKLPKTSIGYPIKYYRIDELEYWDDNKNRYLFKYGTQYCIADSTLKIIVGLSDSIIPTILIDSLGPIVIDYNGKVNFSCFFQIIRNNKTQLLNNDGTSITSIPYDGLIVFPLNNLHKALEQKVYITTTFDERVQLKYGLVDSIGNMLLPIEYDYVLNSPFHWPVDSYFIFYKTYVNGATKNCTVFSIVNNSIVFVVDDMNIEYPELDVYIYEKDGLFGIYNPMIGIVEKPKYEKIYRKKVDHNAKYEGLTLVTKKGKEITWEIPDEIWDLYPMITRN